MPSPIPKKSQPRAEPDETPVVQGLRRTRKATPSFGRDKNGPASSPPPSPAQLVTPEPRRSRRLSARLSREPISEDELGADTLSSTVSDNDRVKHPSTPSRSPGPTTPREALVPPKLQSFNSAPSPSTSVISGSERPSPRQRSASEQTPQKPSPAHINRGIKKLLEKNHPAPKKEGYNYVLTAARYEEGYVLYKVGKSVDVEARKRAIKRKCKFDELMETHGSISDSLEMYHIAEKLIQKELECFQVHEPCPCNTKHTEYFWVEDEKVVAQAFKRWHNFCKQKPWDKEGRLSPWWVYRLKHRPEMGDSSDHQDLVRVWEQFVSPTTLQELIWDARYTWDQVSPHRWQTVVFVEAMVIALLLPMSRWPWIWMLCICACMYLDRMELGPLRTLKHVSDWLDKVGVEEVAKEKKPLVDPRAVARSQERYGNNVNMKKDDHTSSSVREMNRQDYGMGPSESDSHIEQSGVWNDGDQASEEDGTVPSGAADDTFDMEQEEDTEDADESMLTVDSDTSFLGCNRDSPIVIV